MKNLLLAHRSLRKNNCTKKGKNIMVNTLSGVKPPSKGGPDGWRLKISPPLIPPQCPQSTIAF